LGDKFDETQKPKMYWNELSELWVYRIVPLANLRDDLTKGLFSKSSAPPQTNRLVIANTEVIKERDKRTVPCFPGTVVNDFVPFYFSVRTPMLYNLVTGIGVLRVPQENIIYLCCRFSELATDPFQWCFTNGNAAKTITKYYTEHSDLKLLDWKSIETEDFRHDNADGDEDRVRKKHAEFLVYGHVPASKISQIVVLNAATKRKVESILEACGLAINVYINPEKKYYFL
jgi:hypothetical protein